MTNGHAHAADALGPVLWMPLGPCEHVMDDFCVYASLFCDTGHLEHLALHGR